MQKRKRLLIASTAVLIAVFAFILFAPNKKHARSEIATGETHTTSSAFISVSGVPGQEDAHDPALSTEKAGYCETLREKIPTPSEWAKKERVTPRFENVHKKVDGIIYRLRFFYKDHAEGEVPTYLLYREDQQENAFIVENSAYKKGKNYLKIEKAQGEILYTEQGLNVGDEDEIFLHYVNNELKGFQGRMPEIDNSALIDCRF